MKKQKRSKFTFFLGSLFVIISFLFGVNYLNNQIPEKIYLQRQEDINEVLPKYVTYNKSVPVSTNGSYSLSCSLFKILPLKEVKVEMVEKQWVKACGEPIGIYMQTKGVLVIETAQVQNKEGIMEEPAKNILKPGDCLLEINGEKMEGKETLIQKLEESQGEKVVVKVMRKEEELEVSIKPVLGEDEIYRLGIWVRDDIQGIGTLTYIKEDGTFGALGHGISDTDTGIMLPLDEGILYKTQILSVKKGSKGSPGELTGVINYMQENELGSIVTNTDCGIFGRLNEETGANLISQEYEVGLKQDVVEGPANILCSVDGQVQSYEVMIGNIRYNAKEANKSFVVTITDPELIGITGGIVQGMSGSPIIQNNKIIGAVTHVFVQDSASGYGIFIENMMNKYAE